MDLHILCAAHCVCPTEDAAVRNPDGSLNVSAFVPHMYCRTCKQGNTPLEIEMDIQDVMEEGASVNVQMHGYCRGCGRDYYMDVSAGDVDAPVVDAHQAPQVERTEAELLVAANRRWRLRRSRL